MDIQNNNPLVSIIIPTYNRSSLLKRAVLSALNQSYVNIEVIVVDDNSNDNTVTVINELQKNNANLYYYKNENGKGACSARNYGIIKSKGVFVAGLDDDDEFTKNRIELLLNNFKGQYAFVCSSYKRNQLPKKHLKVIKYFPFKIVMTKNDLLWANFASNQVLTKRESLIEINGFDASLPCNQDWDTWVRLLNGKAKGLYIPDILQCIYIDNNRDSITKSADRKKGLFNFYEKYNKEMTFWQKHFFLKRISRFNFKKSSILQNISILFYIFFLIKKILIGLVRYKMDK